MPLQNTSGAADRLSTAADIAPPTAFGAEPVAPPWDGDDWLEPIEALIERYPWPTVLLALGIGYVIARRTR